MRLISVFNLLQHILKNAAVKQRTNNKYKEEFTAKVKSRYSKSFGQRINPFFNRFHSKHTKRISFIIHQKEETILSSQTVFKTFEPITILNTYFIAANSGSLPGGAILSFCPLYLKECYFFQCRSWKSSGAIESYSNTSLDLTKIECCNAVSCGAINLDSSEPVFSNFTKTSIIECHSDYLGTVYQSSANNLFFDFSNITESITKYGATNFYLYRGSISSRCSYLTNSISGDHCAGIRLAYCDNIFADQCFFFNLTRSQNVGPAGSGLYIDFISDQNVIFQSTFRKCNQFNQSSVYAGGSGSLYLIACCFDLHRTIEKMYILNTVFFKGCFFNATCLESIAYPDFTPFDQNIIPNTHRQKVQQLFCIILNVSLLIMIVSCLKSYFEKPTKLI